MIFQFELMGIDGIRSGKLGSETVYAAATEAAL